MLSRALNFLMVPLGLNQLCCLFGWTSASSFIRCFHSWAIKAVRILWSTLIQMSYVVSVCHWSWHVNTHCCSCRPKLKWSILDGWKTSTKGAVGRNIIQFTLVGLLRVLSAEMLLLSPGPCRYWDREKCRRITMGSDGLILQALATSTWWWQAGGFNLKTKQYKSWSPPCWYYTIKRDR